MDVRMTTNNNNGKVVFVARFGVVAFQDRSLLHFAVQKVQDLSFYDAFTEGVAKYRATWTFQA